MVVLPFSGSVSKHFEVGQPRASGGMADALASGASVLRDVGVQVPLRPPRAVQLRCGIKVRSQKCGLTFLHCQSLITDVRCYFRRCPQQRDDLPSCSHAPRGAVTRPLDCRVVLCATPMPRRGLRWCSRGRGVRRRRARRRLVRFSGWVASRWELWFEHNRIRLSASVVPPLRHNRTWCACRCRVRQQPGWRHPRSRSNSTRSKDLVGNLRLRPQSSRHPTCHDGPCDVRRCALIRRTPLRRRRSRTVPARRRDVDLSGCPRHRCGSRFRHRGRIRACLSWSRRRRPSRRLRRRCSKARAARDQFSPEHSRRARCW